MNTQDYIQLENQYGAKNYKPLDVVINKGQGIWVWDVDGNKYLDFLSAYSAVNQGHCHPKIAAVMHEQLDKLTLTSRAFRNDQLGLFYKELCELTNSHMVLPMNSGAEAVESCIKAVRKWGYREKGVPEGQAEMGRWVAAGKVKFAVHLVDGLEQAPSALNLLFTGGNRGKVIVRVE